MEFKKTAKVKNDRPNIAVPQRMPVTSTPATPKSPTPKHGIHIPFPTKKDVTSLFTKRVVLIPLCCAFAIIGLGATWGTMSNQKQADNIASTSARTRVENLEYQTILPNGKSISDLGGWQRVSPSKNDPVYAYTDAINGIAISVSQQPLPQSFIGNVDTKTADLAKSYSATNKISAGATTVYIGTSSKGPQSVILTKDSLLILIKSKSKIDDTLWAKYVESLN